MNFETVQEAFNHYKNVSLTVIESRASELKTLIQTDASVDIAKANIEIEGLSEAKKNAEERQSGQDGELRAVTNIITKGANKPMKKEQEIFETVEYRNAFFKSLLGQQLSQEEQSVFTRAMETQEVERRADAFNTTTNSAAVLPTTTLNEVIKKASVLGGLVSEIRPFNIPTKISIPIGTPATKASWHTEGASVDEETVQTASVVFENYELIKVFSLSASAKKMSIPAFEAYVVEELANSVMEAIADSIVNGTGVGQGTGLVTGITWDASNQITATGSLKYSDVTSGLALLKRGYANGAKFAMSNATLYRDVFNVVDGNGRPLFVQDTNRPDVGYLLGKEVVIDDNIADGIIILGNFKYMGYNLPQGLLVEASRDSSFKRGLVDYRALAIADVKPLVPEAFVRINTVIAP